MASDIKLQDFDRVLIVEGYSDLLFYAELLEFLGKGGTVFIKQFNGKEDLILKLETFITPLLLAEKQRVAVIVDANGDSAGAFNKLRSTLGELTGQIVSAPGMWTVGNPEIGLFVTPDGRNNGEIETLVWRAWAGDPANQQQKLCIETFVSCMNANGYSPHSPDKGLISSLLAIRCDEDPRLGPGARTREVFDFERPEYEQLRAFLSVF